MQDFWWVWIVAGLILIMAEFFTPSFYLSCLGIGAIVGGIFGLVGLNIFWQVGAFAVVSAVLLPFAQKLSKWVRKRTPGGVGSDRYVGQVGVVTEEINNLKNTGRVRLEGDYWRAETAKEDTVFYPDERVLVVNVRGTKLVVDRRDISERS